MYPLAARFLGPVAASRFAGVGAISARYWQVFITSNNGDADYTALARVEMYSSALDGAGRIDRCTGGTPIFSTQGGFGNNPSQYADKAFDDNNATIWATAFPTSSNRINSSIGCDFGSPIAIDRFAIRSTGSLLALMPQDMSLQYSYNGVTWATLFSPASQTSWLVNQQRLFTAPGFSPGSYSGSPHGEHRYWRIYSSIAQDGGFGISIAEAQFRATPGGSDQSTGGTFSASSSFDGSVTAGKAFDNDNATLWASAHSPNGAWLKCDFGAGNPVAVSEVAMRARAGSFFAQIPDRGTIEFSDDDTNWSTAWEFDFPAFTDGEEKVTTDPAYV